MKNKTMTLTSLKIFLFGTIVTCCLNALAQPRGLPRGEISGKAVPIDVLRNSSDISQIPAIRIPAPDAPSDKPESDKTIDLLSGMSCPGKGVPMIFYEHQSLCSNGFMLTPEGTRDVHCEYLFFNFYQANFNGCDLSGLDLNGLTLQGADFSGANLTGTNLSNTDLRHATFRDAVVVDSRFEGANLASTRWHDSTIERASFINANMVSVHIRAENTPMMIIRDSDFSGVSGPLYTNRSTHWLNTICPDKANSEINPDIRRSCSGARVVVGY